MDRNNHRKKLNEMKKKIVAVLRKHGVRKAGIFGSHVRGENRKNSDIDIIIMPPRTMSLLGFAHLKHELESKLGAKVDLVSYRGVHPRLEKNILSEEVKII